MTQRWFGLTQNDMFHSIISPYIRVLTESEFIVSPMSYYEKNKADRDVLLNAYKSFYSKYILTCKELKWCADDFVKKRVGSIEKYLNEFLLEEKMYSFLDEKNGYIFQTDWYLEVHIFSLRPTKLELESGLYLRTQNSTITWEETNWA